MLTDYEFNRDNILLAYWHFATFWNTNCLNELKIRLNKINYNPPIDQIELSNFRSNIKAYTIYINLIKRILK